MRNCSPSVTVPMPASSCSLSQMSAASRLASSRAVPSSFHFGQSFSVSASQPGFGRLPAIVVGLFLAGVFCLGGLVVRDLPWLGDQVRNVLELGAHGGGPAVLAVTLLTGIAEEIFFRGAVYAAVPRRPLLVTTIAYVLATLATGNPMLGFAAVLLGLVTGLQRRASGGVLAPILTHVVWSGILFFALPRIFGI